MAVAKTSIFQFPLIPVTVIATLTAGTVTDMVESFHSQEPGTSRGDPGWWSHFWLFRVKISCGIVLDYACAETQSPFCPV